MKLCIWCLTEKPSEDFYRNANSGDDKQSYCIACKAAYDIFLKQCVNVSVKAGRLASRRTRELLKQKHELERKLQEIDTEILNHTNHHQAASNDEHN